MKALCVIKLPRAAGSDEEARRSIDTNQFLLNKNFKQIEETIRILEERVHALELEE